MKSVEGKKEELPTKNEFVVVSCMREYNVSMTHTGSRSFRLFCLFARNVCVCAVEKETFKRARRANEKQMAKKKGKMQDMVSSSSATRTREKKTRNKTPHRLCFYIALCTNFIHWECGERTQTARKKTSPYICGYEDIRVRVFSRRRHLKGTDNEHSALDSNNNNDEEGNEKKKREHKIDFRWVRIRWRE